MSVNTSIIDNCGKFSISDIGTGGKFAAGITAINVNLRQGVTTRVIDLYCRGLCCTWLCQHHRGRSCTWTFQYNTNTYAYRRPVYTTGPQLHLDAPKHQEPLLLMNLHNRGLSCTWTSLDYRSLCCSCICLHHRGLCCTYPVYCIPQGPELHLNESGQKEPVLVWMCLHHRGLSCTWMFLLYRGGLSCT